MRRSATALHLEPISQLTRFVVSRADAESAPHLAYMAAFKAHCAFGFRHGSQVVNTGKSDQAMGQFGRIESMRDLPGSRELTAMIRKATALIDAGVKPPRAPKTGDLSQPRDRQ